MPSDRSITVDSPSQEWNDACSLLLFELRSISPFFAALALFSEQVITEAVPTAATDGKRIYFNPRFMASLTRPERLGVLVHELLHAALLHPSRNGGRDPELWNVAADIVINGIIDEHSPLSLPAGALRDRWICELPVEEVYDILLRRKESDSPAGERLRRFLVGPDLLPPPADAPATPEHWQSALAQASSIAELAGKGIGSIPASLARLIDAASSSTLDWRAILWRHLVSTPVDFTSFDRRFIGEGLYLDSLDGEKLRVAICIDTSGSIGNEDLSRFLAEVLSITRTYPHIEAELYCADAELHGPWAIDTQKESLPQLKGGGGTSFIPFFQALEKKNPAPDIAVYLTDGFGSFPAEPPKVSSLWVILPGGLPSHKFPFGETARMTEKEVFNSLA
jgi:predicted metal-dependent peptidase